MGKLLWEIREGAKGLMSKDSRAFRNEGCHNIIIANENPVKRLRANPEK